MKQRYIPDGYETKEYKEVDAIIYSKKRDNFYFAMGYSGKRTKHDFNYKFLNEESYKKYISNYLKNLLDIKEAKLSRKEKRLSFIHSLKEGDILYSSWGYDQTNVDFYQILEVKGKMVKIKEIASEMPNGEEGFMQGYVIPLKNIFISKKVLTKKVGLDNTIRICSFAYASLWDGKPKRKSWYA